MSLLLLAGGALGALALRAQEVTLPLDRYDELRARAFAEPPETPAPVVPVAFEAAVLEIEVGEGRAMIRQRLELSVTGGGWNTLPLPALGTFVSAQLGELEGNLGPGSPWALRLKGEGRHRIVLDSVLPVVEDATAVRPTWRMELELPRAAAVRTTIRPGRGIEELQAGGDVLLVAENDGTWSLVAEPGSRAALTLLGTAAAPERDARPLSFGATVSTATEVRRTATRVDAWIQLRIRQGSLESLDVPLPRDLELVDVAGRNVGGWEVAEDRVRVQARLPVSEAWELQLSLAGPPSSSFASALLTPSGAVGVQYFAKVDVRGDGLLSLTEEGSARWAETREVSRLPAPFQSAAGRVSAVLDPRRPPRWEVAWADGAEVLAAQVDHLMVEVLAGEPGRAFLQLWALVRSSGAATVSLEPPPGFELVSSRRDGDELAAGRQGDALVLPLRRAESAQLLYVAGFLPLPLPDRGLLEVPLPAFSAPVAEVSVRVLLPEGREAALAEPSRRGAFGRPPQPAAGEAVPELAGRLLGPDGGRQPAEGAASLPRPAGFRALEAAWTALSPQPAPLILKLGGSRREKEWF